MTLAQQDEATFLAEFDPAKYPPIAVSVDTVVLTIREGTLHCLVIERENHPYRGYLALPGMFLKPDADLVETARSGVTRKTGVIVNHIEQLGTYGSINRDPRMRTVSIAYLAFGPTINEPKPLYHATDARWFPVFRQPAYVGMAFDHHDIMVDGITRAKDKLEYTSLATRFLREEFTMTELMGVYEAVWNQRLDRGNFYRKVKSVDGFVIPTGKKAGNAALFRAGPAHMLYPPIRREKGHWESIGRNDNA